MVLVTELVRPPLGGAGFDSQMSGDCEHAASIPPDSSATPVFDDNRTPHLENAVAAGQFEALPDDGAGRFGANSNFNLSRANIGGEEHALSLDAGQVDPLSFGEADAERFVPALFCGPEAAHGLIEIDFEDANGNLTGHSRFPVSKWQAAIAKAKWASDNRRRAYFGAGLRRPDLGQGERSTNGDIVAWPALVYDFDSKEDAEYGLQQMEALGLRPQFVCQTGAIRNHDQPDLRIQTWFLLTRPCYDLDKVNRALRAGIRVFGSDKSIHDARRIMRVPGSIAWARKDGRVDEPTILRDDLADFGPRYDIDELIAKLGAAEPASQYLVREQRAAVPRAGLDDGSGAASLWRNSQTVNVFMADLEAGIEMNPSLYGLCLAAARDGHSAEVISAHAEGLLLRSAAVVSRPDRVSELRKQLPFIVKRAVADSGVCNPAPYQPAAEDFSDGAPPPPKVELDARERMFERTVLVEETMQFHDLPTGTTRSAPQFNAHYSTVGPPASKTRCASAVFLAAHSQDDPIQRGPRKTARGFTYAPHEAQLVRTEDGAWEVNRYQPSAIKPDLAATEDDVRPWLDVMLHLAGDHAGHFLDFLAHLLQRPGVKINHAILVKSIQGTGKSTLMTAIFAALGEHNCRAIGPELLVSPFNDWLAARQLIVVEEMQHFDQKSTMNAIKSQLVGNPAKLTVNPKGKPAYEVPNLAAYVFFSNLDVPVKLEASDRRFYIIDSAAPRLPPEKASAVHAFYRAGGAAKVAGWLLKRDISHFDPFGPPPMTDGKLALLEASREPRDCWLDDFLADPACPPLVCVEVVRRAMVQELGIPSAACSAQRVGQMLRARGGRLPHAGPVRLSPRPLGGGDLPERSRLYSLRDHEHFAMLAQAGPAALYREYLTLHTRAHDAACEARMGAFDHGDLNLA